MLNALLLLALTQAPPDIISESQPALVVYPTQASGAPLGTGECSGTAIAGSYGEAVTVSNATPAYCHTSLGTLAAIPANAPAVTQNGLYSAPAEKNMVIQSDDLATGWTAAGSASVTSTNVADFGTGSATMDEVTDGAGAASYVYRNTSSWASAKGPRTASIWVRAKTGTKAVSMAGECSTAPYGDPTACTCSTSDGSACVASVPVGSYACVASATVTTTPVRLSLTTTCPNNATVHALYLRSDAWGAGGSGVAYWGGAQFVEGSLPGSYCPTTTTQVTCSAATASVAVPATMTDSAGCVSEDVYVLASANTSGNRVFAFNGGLGPFVNNAGLTQLCAFDGTSTPCVTLGATMTGRWVNVRTWWSTAANQLGIEADGLTATSAYDGATVATPFYLSSHSNGVQNASLVRNLKMESSPYGCR